MTMEQCLVLIKPDAMVKNLAGDIIGKLADTGLKLVGAKLMQVTKDLAEEHYQHLKDKDFFDELIKYIMGEYHGREVLALVYEGNHACKTIRDLAGATNPEEAQPTSVRGKYGRIASKGMFENVVHASENTAEGEREIKLWFRPNELISTIWPVSTQEVTSMKTSWKE